MSGSDELFISQFYRSIDIIIRALKQLEISGSVTLLAINMGIERIIDIAQFLKRALKGLHQVNSFEKVLDSSKTRAIIKLGFIAQDVSSPGYQKPIPENDARDKTFEELKKLAGEKYFQIERYNSMLRAKTTDIVEGERERERGSGRICRKPYRVSRGRELSSRNFDSSLQEANHLEVTARSIGRGFRGSRGLRGPRGLRVAIESREETLFRELTLKISSFYSDYFSLNWMIQGQERGDPGDLIQRIAL